MDTINANANFHPTGELTLGADFNYTDNLIGTLYQSIISAGGILQQSTRGNLPIRGMPVVWQVTT